MTDILDACCGSKMFWFNKHNPSVTYMDKRNETVTAPDSNWGHDRVIEIKPDIVADFRNMPFDDNSFYMVIFTGMLAIARIPRLGIYSST